GIAHELNQPLTAITTYARACERNLALDKPDMADVSEAVREINAEGLRAGEIIRRLRQMVKVDAPDERVPLEAHTLLEELRSLLQSDARAHDAQLRLSLAPDLPAVTVNAVQIQQVVLNLVRNALEAVQADPAGAREVIVSAGCTEDSELEIRVTDNGPGIDAQIQNKLFDPFSTTKSSGTGLGLAISRTIVQSHGGSIGAQPATPRGTTFYVRLPATEEFAR
ncbi:MAG TPA: HAMP domain-containing sensor histidine kinase, partial [Steroidobacteraceae bacterium]|nr:HAMP domain-containing sensor histidine kinase [Steroidobacteraceae bacterium]